MIKKNELRGLRALRVTPAIKDRAQGNDEPFEEIIEGRKRQYEHRYGCFLRVQQLGVYLKIAMFFSVEINAGQQDPHYEIYINPGSGEYITRVLEDGKEVGWSSSMIEHLTSPNNRYSSWYYNKNMSWINPEGAQTIKRILKAEEKDVYYAILNYQKRMRKERRDMLYDRNIEKWEQDVKVPALTDSMVEWLEREVVQEQYIFYKYQRSGVKEGYCTYCEQMVPMPERYKNNLKSTCPICRKKVELKSIGNRREVTTGWHMASVMRYVENGNLIIQRFAIRNTIVYPFNKVEHVVTEDYRYVYDGESITQYERGYYKNYKMCWHKPEYSSYFEPSSGKIYKKNLRTLSEGLLKRSGLIEMIRQDKLGTISVYRWLRTELGNPLLEQLAKMDMCKLAREIADCRYDRELLNESATSAAELMKLDKARLKRLRAFGKNANLYHVKWLQYEKRKNTQYPDELINFYAVNEIHFKDFDFLPVKLGFVEIKNYLVKQSAKSNDNVHQTLGTWRDYIGLAKKVKMQLTVEQVYKPSDLARKHTELIDLLKNDDMKATAKKIEKQWEKVNEVLEGLQKYRYTDGVYTISTPSSVYDIVREGTLLSHCIHTVDYYWDRITRRESYIFFLRKALTPDTPWYTLEVEPGGAIRQKRTTGDNQNPDLKPAEPFLRIWQKEIKKVLTEEDRRLAEESKKLREKGYKELREKGERIRRGKLAGQLLADVLEKDFMDAAV